MFFWLVGAVIGLLLVAAWFLDRRRGSGYIPERAFRRSTQDFARGEHYRFMRRG
jgi:hypothetical protein